MYLQQVTVPVVGLMSGTVFAASEAEQKNDTLMIDEVCLSQKHINICIAYNI